MIKKIASIYFDDVELDRDLYGGHYRIAAVPKGAEPTIIIIKDEVQRWQQPHIFQKAIKRDHISALSIALDCILHWTRNAPGMSPDCHPGIWLVRDEMPLLKENGLPETDADGKQQTRAATDEEKELMWAEDLAHARVADAAWAAFRIQQADAWYETPKDRMFIGTNHRRAAQHYGKERAWLKTLQETDQKQCQFCKTHNQFDAVICANCHQIIDVVRYRQLKAREKELEQSVTPPPDPKWVCNDCGVPFPNKQALVQHRMAKCAKEPEPVGAA